MKKLNVTTTTVTQTGSEELGTKEKKLYYLIIEDGVRKVIINVGEKTIEKVNQLKTEQELKLSK